MKRRILIGAAALTVASALTARAAEPGEFVLPVCDSPDSLAVIATGERDSKALGDAFDALRAASKLSCVTAGPIAGTWVIDGTKRAMNVGILPVGIDAQPHLQVWSPRFQLIGPLQVQLRQAETKRAAN